jgi:hypothetical protein
MFSSDCSEALIHKAKELGATAFYPKTRLGIIADVLRKYFGEPSGSATVL